MGFAEDGLAVNKVVFLIYNKRGNNFAFIAW